jgi:hypothetical protein
LLLGLITISFLSHLPTFLYLILPQESSKAEDAIYRSGFTAEDCWGDQEEEEEEYGEEL